MDAFSHIWNIGLILVSAHSLYILVLAIYNICFHPLSKFPGKKIDAAFQFPWHYHQMTGNSAAYIKGLHEQFGDVVRIAPFRLSFSTSQAWRDINGRQKGKNDLVRDPTIFYPRPGIAPDIVLSNDADHTRMRRVLAHAFSNGALREQEPLIHQYCDLLVSRLNEQIDGETKGIVDITRWFNFATFDIIGELIFSEPFKALEKGEYHKWIGTIFASLKSAPFIIYASETPILSLLLSAVLKYAPGVEEAALEHTNFTKDSVVMRLESSKEHKDFLSHILRHNSRKGLTQEEIISNSTLLILAGSETIATLLSGLTFLLLKNPESLSQLTDEIRNSFTSADEMTFAGQAKLPYLNACIEEALRIYPPSPSATPLWTPPEGMTVEGRWVPGNVSVAVHPLAAFHSAKNFTDPMAFVPERWMGDERFIDDDRAVMLPFGFGSHGCLGMRLAYAEIRSILVRFLWNFDLELCNDSRDFLNQKIFVVWDKPALNVKLSPRKGR